MKLLWSPRALRQLKTAVNTIAQDDPAAAWRVYDRILERAQELLGFPEMAPPGREPATRQLVITGTPYVVVYRLKANAIQIAAVWHTRQRRTR
jgi:toxin ParE1/3/4